MRVLEGSAEISTRYGGGFVQSIEGLEAEQSDGRSLDWFFYVNGVESTRRRRRLPAARRRVDLVGLPRLDRGDAGARRGRLLAAALRSTATRAGAGRSRSSAWAAGAPAPRCGERLRAGRRRRRLGGSPRGRSGSWSAPGRGCGDDPAAAQIEDGPQASGVFAEFRRAGGDGFELRGSTKAASRAIELRPRRRPGRRDPPLRSAAGLGRHRGDARPGCGRPPACSTRTTCATITRSPSRGRGDLPLPARDEIAVRLHAAAGAAAGGLAGRRRHLPRARWSSSPSSTPTRSSCSRSASPRSSPACSPAPRARCARRSGWA